MIAPLSGRATHVSTAPAQAIWELLVDIPRMGEWSPECTRAEWLDGATEAVEGARFRGTNRWGPMVWSTTCSIEKVLPLEVFTFGARHWSGALTRWTYELRPQPQGTLLAESFQTVGTPRVVLFLDRASNRPRRLHAGMATTLARLSAAAERRNEF